jgi:co-chaperonin GroES (HSP10)
MLPSRYLESFKLAKDKASDDYQLYGDTLLVERVPEEEVKTSSGIVLATSIKNQVGTIAENKPFFVHVLAVGPGYYDADGKDVPVSVVPGDIILVGVNSVKWFSHLEIPNYESFSIGLTREAEIQLKFKGLESYRRFFEAINSVPKK